MRVSAASELEQGEDPAWVAVENALRKARAVARPRSPEAVLGCDTIVVLDGVIYGKPADEQAACATLNALGGRTHEVISGVAMLLSDGAGGLVERTVLARTSVTFRSIDRGMLDWYVSTGEWRGRSGGYAIQGAGSKLALAIDGEEDNVVGLPLSRLGELEPDLFGASARARGGRGR